MSGFLNRAEQARARAREYEARRDIAEKNRRHAAVKRAENAASRKLFDRLGRRSDDEIAADLKSLHALDGQMMRLREMLALGVEENRAQRAIVQLECERREVLARLGVGVEA